MRDWNFEPIAPCTICLLPAKRQQRTMYCSLCPAYEYYLNACLLMGLRRRWNASSWIRIGQKIRPVRPASAVHIIALIPVWSNQFFLVVWMPLWAGENLYCGVHLNAIGSDKHSTQQWIGARHPLQRGQLIAIIKLSKCACQSTYIKDSRHHVQTRCVEWFPDRTDSSVGWN